MAWEPVAGIVAWLFLCGLPAQAEPPKEAKQSEALGQVAPDPPVVPDANPQCDRAAPSLPPRFPIPGYLLRQADSDLQPLCRPLTPQESLESRPLHYDLTRSRAPLILPYFDLSFRTYV